MRRFTQPSHFSLFSVWHSTHAFCIRRVCKYSCLKVQLLIYHNVQGKSSGKPYKINPIFLCKKLMPPRRSTERAQQNHGSGRILNYTSQTDGKIIVFLEKKSGIPRKIVLYLSSMRNFHEWRNETCRLKHVLHGWLRVQAHYGD